MRKNKKYMNAGQGGRAAEIRFRGIVANPNGNREERRAAKKLRVLNSRHEEDG